MEESAKTPGMGVGVSFLVSGSESLFIPFQFLEPAMDSELAAFAHADPAGETATHPIARLACCLAALLLVAGNDLPPCRALPGSAPDVYSGTSNCGF